MDTLQNQIIFRNKYNINDNQLVLLEIILIAQNEEDNETVKMYFASTKDIRLNLVSLQDAGIILKSYKIPEKGEKLDIYAIPINKNFIKDFYKSSFEMGKELREHYPRFRNINGCLTSMLGVSKKFNSLEDAYRTYGKKIHWNEELHKKIIDLLDWEANTDNGIINYSLATFIVDEKWEDLEALKNGDSGMNYNSITTL